MSWSDFNTAHLRYPELGLSLDLSMMGLPADQLETHAPLVERTFDDMRALEGGGIANPDENRMVGHYWLRAPNLAPTPELQGAIAAPLLALKAFAEQVHTGGVRPPGGGVFEQLLVIGIGGSALGPQLVADALAHGARMPIHFLDNTDPQGIDHTLDRLTRLGLGKTLVIVISKSGGTPETRNGMLETRAAYKAAGLHFGSHAVAITGPGSKLDQYAENRRFITRFPMEDWVGGRTSVLSTVGLVPAALQGIDIDAMLAGAAAMDAETRKTDDPAANPALRLALAWHHATGGRGEKDMVVLPYKDSLVLFSKYLQHLVMESLGKAEDLDGRTVNQGIAVYGNKGSTDQHAYVQQLRDGVNNFFATFIEVRKGRSKPGIEVDPGVTSADYLQGFLRGTRKALHESGRQSLTISIPEVTPFQLGVLIALFERAVSFYASLVNINAYHQPGVEAGKKAAVIFLDLLNHVRGRLTAESKNAVEIAFECDADPEDAYHCLTHLAANGECQQTLGKTPADDQFHL